MQKITVSLAIIATAACSAAPSDGPELSESRFSLRTEATAPTDPASCEQDGVFYDADGRVIVCYSGGVRVAVGDVNNDGTVELHIDSTTKHPLPTTHVIPEGARATLADGIIAVDSAKSVALVPEDAPVPAGGDVAPDCDGVMIDPDTGDVLICMETTALLLPAVQKVREAASRPSHASGATGGGAGKISWHGVHMTARGGAGLDVLIGNAGGARVGTAALTSDGLGILKGMHTMAAKAKADILIESLEELG